MENLKIEIVNIDTIHAYDKNARVHSEEQIAALAQSIKQLGFNNPILISPDAEIIAGHGRFAAAQTMGLKTVPVIRLNHLTESQRRLFRLADNKIAEQGGWNLELLKLELSELDVMCEEIDITDTGFTTLELDSLFTDKPEKATETQKADAKINAVPYIPDDEIITQPGDIWNIDRRHRIICGNSLQEATYSKLMGGSLANLILSDPPYNVSAASIGNSGKYKHQNFVMAAGEMTEAEFTAFLTTVMQNCSKYSTPKALGYYWMDWRHSWEILSAGRTVYPLFVNLCVWSKTSGGMGRLYRSQHELCFIFGKDKHYLDNVELGKHGRYRTNVWKYAGVNSFGAHKGDQKYHPTTKPVELISEILLDVTPRGGSVLDAFLGSGTTLLAAEKTKRICFGIEYEPKYIDTAIRRYRELFGVDAVNERTGKTYSEMLDELKSKNSLINSHNQSQVAKSGVINESN